LLGGKLEWTNCTNTLAYSSKMKKKLKTKVFSLEGRKQGDKKLLNNWTE
jgi:hypothetical protein